MKLGVNDVMAKSYNVTEQILNICTNCVNLIKGTHKTADLSAISHFRIQVLSPSRIADRVIHLCEATQYGVSSLDVEIVSLGTLALGDLNLCTKVHLLWAT